MFPKIVAPNLTIIRDKIKQKNKNNNKNPLLSLDYFHLESI